MLAARGVAARERAHQRQVHGDELLARLAVAVEVIPAQQVLVELLGVVLAPALRVRGGPVLRRLRALALLVVVRHVPRLAGQRLEVERVVDASVVATAHAGRPVRCLTMTTLKQPSSSCTTTSSTSRRSSVQRSMQSPGVTRPGRAARRAERAGGDAQRAVVDHDEDAQTVEVLRVESRLQQAVGGEEEVVEVVEREVETRAEAAEHHAHGGEGAQRRRHLEGDRLSHGDLRRQAARRRRAAAGRTPRRVREPRVLPSSRAFVARVLVSSAQRSASPGQAAHDVEVALAGALVTRAHVVGQGDAGDGAAHDQSGGQTHAQTFASVSGAAAAAAASAASAGRGRGASSAGVRRRPRPRRSAGVGGGGRGAVHAARRAGGGAGRRALVAAHEARDGALDAGAERRGLARRGAHGALDRVGHRVDLVGDVGDVLGDLVDVAEVGVDAVERRAGLLHERDGLLVDVVEHRVDAPQRPAGLEQRVGRGDRHDHEEERRRVAQDDGGSLHRERPERGVHAPLLPLITCRLDTVRSVSYRVRAPGRVAALETLPANRPMPAAAHPVPAGAVCRQRPGRRPATRPPPTTTSSR